MHTTENTALRGLPQALVLRRSKCTSLYGCWIRSTIKQGEKSEVKLGQVHDLGDAVGRDPAVVNPITMAQPPAMGAATMRSVEPLQLAFKESGGCGSSLGARPEEPVTQLAAAMRKKGSTPVLCEECDMRALKVVEDASASQM